MSKNVLAFDFGASSGRALIFSYENGKLTYEEIHRFDNDPVMVRGNYHWDVLRLFHEIKQGILKCKNLGKSFDAIGIDTWGVDYGLLDKDGRLLQNPYHYRDTRTDAVVLTEEQKQKIFDKTGIQFAFINTLFQYMCSAKEPVFSAADSALFVPDLFNYMLTGIKKTEYTIASTSQMLNAKARDFDDELLKSFELDNKFADIVMPGTIIGNLSDEICEELGVKSVPVIAVASHDTASAVVAAPMSNPGKNLYISCGTWLLLGAETNEPIITEQSQAYNYTNEGGVFGTYRFLHNIMGLWIQQESRRALARKGTKVSYQELEDAAVTAQPFKCIINPNYDAFSRPGDMVSRIEKFAEMTNQPKPETLGELNRTIIESLALECAKSVKEISTMLPEKIDAIHAVGGGTQSKILCQFIANATKIPVIAGPVEATSIGNALMQYVALDEIDSLEDARKVVENSFDLVRYEPMDTDAWDKAYEKYIEICK
ncbi:MAG: rhamnulokinase [Ruminococcaceae bacterium]|nr:rhamnulokinase [Oscillospiraceae bacterium]